MHEVLNVVARLRTHRVIETQKVSEEVDIVLTFHVPRLPVQCGYGTGQMEATTDGGVA